MSIAPASSFMMNTSLAKQFSELYLTDPIMLRLHQGKQQWGEVPFEDWELELAAAHPYVRIPSVDKPLEEPSAKPVVAPTVAIPAGTSGIKTLMAKNLPRDITVEKLRSVFEVHGAIRDIYIPKNMDKNSPYFGTIKGFAKIQYLTADDSAKAYQAELGRLSIGTNKIVIEFAKEDR
jgi:hypothetical protein